MTDTGGTDDLARRKAEAEIAKLEAEAAKARREGRGIGARIGVVVSVATVLTSLTIGGSQVWIAREKSESDRRLAEIDLGLKTTGFVLERRERFLAAPPEGQVAFVGLVVHIFPPADARRLLAQLGQDLASQAAAIAAICSALGRLGDIGAQTAEQLRCTGEPALPAEAADRHEAEAIERRAAAQGAAPDPCADLPEPSEPELRVFPHVTARQDRVYLLERSAELAQAIGWPLAGVEFVNISWTRPDGEVRYYFPDQCRLAVQLRERFKRALRAGGLREPPQLSVRYIGINYRNLPRGRIEVWLPPLTR